MSRIPATRLANLCHRVATSYQAGVDVRTIWEREADKGGPAHRMAMKKVADRVASGATVAQGMEATDGYFPELAIAIVQAGEKGGRMERAFQLLSRHYDAIVKFRREMQTRLAWPVMELIGAICIIGLLILVMGWFTDFDWIGWGWSTGQYFWAYVATVFLLSGSLFTLIFGIRAGWFGVVPMQIARRIPLIGKTIQIFALSRFAWVLAAVYEAGMNTIEGVRLAFRATQNYFYQRLEDDAADKLQSGQELQKILRESEAFPEDLIMYVENGELTGQMPESMTRLAEQYSAEAEKNLNILSKVLFMILFCIIAMIIVAMIITLYYQLYFNRLQEYM